MKKLLMILGLVLIMANVGYAQDRYFVEVDINTKENKSDYILKDGDELETLSKDRVLIEFATKEDYLKACAGNNWETEWIVWKKVKANSNKIDIAIANKIDKKVQAEATLKKSGMTDEQIEALKELLK